MLALLSIQTHKAQRVRIARHAFCASIKYEAMQVEDNMIGNRDREVAPTVPSIYYWLTFYIDDCSVKY